MPSHRADYFSRNSRDWSLLSFLDYFLEKEPSRTDRSILSYWINTLCQIAKCQSRRRCCNTEDRQRARKLRASFRDMGRRSDRQIASEYLREKRPQMSNAQPTVRIDTITNSSVNVTIGGVSNTTSSGTVLASGQPESADPTAHATTGSASDALCVASTSSVTPQDSETSSLDGGEAYDSSNSTDSARVWDAFTDAHSSFDDNLKWRLPSGTTVEDVLYNTHISSPLPAPLESMRLNWVIDVNSSRMQALFDKKDWETIQANIAPLPTVDVEFGKFLSRFSQVKDTTVLDDIICTQPICNSLENCDKTLRSDLLWATRTLSQFLSLWKHESKLLSADHLEDWYTANVWCRLVDDCFLAIPHVTLERKEVVCQSSALRRNSKRVDPSKRFKTGPRLDGILRSLNEASHEFCAIEAAPSLRSSQVSTKWLTDKTKLVKVLRDMLGRLITLTGHDATLAPKLQVVGMSVAGLEMQLSRLCYGKGYVTLFATEEPRNVPCEIEQMDGLLEILPLLLSFKSVLAATVAAFRSRSGSGSGSANDNRIPELPRPHPCL